MADPSRALPSYAAHVYEADAFWVISGANQGDAIAEAGRCEPGDVYRLDPSAHPIRLRLQGPTADGDLQRIAEGSQIGRPGDGIRLLSALTLMTADGDRVEILILHHDVEGRFALPLSPVAPRTDYTLLGASDDTRGLRLADVICVSFAAGTRITLAGGAQAAVETLRPGDSILTRDHGPQPVRWIARATFRALGSFAPVVITAGTLGNDADLVVSPHHRVFLYQRGADRIGGTAEILVQARHLVDGVSVLRREGGFADYYSLVFDNHEIVYAEGVPAESLMVTDDTLTVLPSAIAEEVRARFPGLSHRQHPGTEVGRQTLDREGRQGLFRKPKDG
ncbi:MAG: Hint domain-containing protein [Pseudomonadota bacterium]